MFVSPPPKKNRIRVQIFLLQLVIHPGAVGIWGSLAWPELDCPQGWAESKRQGVGLQESTLNDERDYFSRDPDWEAWRVGSGARAPCQLAETRLRTRRGQVPPDVSVPLG